MDTQSETAWALGRGLAGYVQAVAAAVDVPVEGTSFEISDTATAYLGLSSEWAESPGRDLMLVWSEQHGWSVWVETDPAEAPMVVADFGGDDLVPEPRTVASFASDVVAGRHSGRQRSEFRDVDNRDDLTRRLTVYAIDPE